MEVIKRDGRKEPFNANKIINAVNKAYNACGLEMSKEIETILKELFTVGDTVDIEEIQDKVEEVLMHDNPMLAKSFILFADIYYAAGNKLQAKQTLRSIIENYDGDELVEMAQQKYDRIVNEENKVREEREKQIQQMKENDNEIDMSSTVSEERKTNE